MSKKIKHFLHKITNLMRSQGLNLNLISCCKCPPEESSRNCPLALHSSFPPACLALVYSRNSSGKRTR